MTTGSPDLTDRLPTWREYVNNLIATEISRFTRYYDQVVQWKPRDNDNGVLLEQIECKSKKVVNSFEDFPDLSEELEKRSAVLLNANINHDFDIQATFQQLRLKLSRSSRIVLIAYNPYLAWLYSLANLLGIRKGEQPKTFVTHTDLYDLAKLSGFEAVRIRPMVYVPFKLWKIGDFLNALIPLIPLLKWLSLTTIIVLRPVLESTAPSLSIVIPARNERGNIENALKRMPDFDGAEIEIIFVEGHSTDNTWEEIERVVNQYKDRFQLSFYQQPGKGKGDAVRLGFSKATKDLLTILDADLTMPPELLVRFYKAYCQGLADFINGSRLVYPMEGKAMRFLNRLGNVFFAKALSFVLDTRIGDSLCGTKLMSRSDYERFCSWRKDFGDFDPFGDFELIFPAAILGLGIVDIPIRYRDRTYGNTNISRFRHGMMLLKMTITGLYRIKLGQV